MATRQEQAEIFQDMCLEIQKLNFAPDLLKSPVGRNFRALSEATVLKQINSLLKQFEVDYSITVKESSLRIENLKDKLVFISTCVVRLDFFVCGDSDPIAYCEATGMGIDDGDKAAGKAYTYAVKYALFKKFRLTYADDPDATESEPIKTGPEGSKDTGAKSSPKGSKKASKEELVTEKMTNYIIGLVKELEMSDEDFKKRWGYYPSSPDIPMKFAREIIDKLKDEKLPF